MSTTITVTYHHDGASTSRQLVVPFQLPIALGEQIGLGLLRELGLAPPLASAQVHVNVHHEVGVPADVGKELKPELRIGDRLRVSARCLPNDPPVGALVTCVGLSEHCVLVGHNADGPHIGWRMHRSCVELSEA